MPRRTRNELRKLSRFHTVETPERDVYLLIQHVSGSLEQELAVALKPVGITPEQYHVLRVLRDAGPSGIPCSVVGQRSVSGDPDVTRLLDRLQRRGWAKRGKEAADRRLVTARITSAGNDLLDALDDPVANLHKRQLDSLDPEQLARFHDLLGEVAGPVSD